jgi:hypothetical protein
MQVQQREHLGHLRALPAPRRQDHRPEPGPLASGRIDPLVVDPRRGHLDRPGRGGHRPRPGMPVTHHQPAPVTITLIGEPGQIRLHLGLQHGGQHPPRPFPHDLIQARRKVLAHGPVAYHYSQHRRPSSPARQRRLLELLQRGRYAAPSCRSRIHNFRSYFTAYRVPWRGPLSMRRRVRRRPPLINSRFTQSLLSKDRFGRTTCFRHHEPRGAAPIWWVRRADGQVPDTACAVDSDLCAFCQGER